MFITLVPDHLKHFVQQVHVFTAAQGTGDSDPNSRLHDVVIATLVLANNQVVTGSTVCQSGQTRNFELAGRKAVAKALPKSKRLCVGFSRTVSYKSQPRYQLGI